MVTRVEADDSATEAGSITIVLADDHEVVRNGLRMVLEAEEGFEVVAEAGDLATTRRYVLAHRPNVLVLDLNMPEGSSLPEIGTLREQATGDGRRRAHDAAGSGVRPRSTAVGRARLRAQALGRQ